MTTQTRINPYRFLNRTGRPQQVIDLLRERLIGILKAQDDALRAGGQQPILPIAFHRDITDVIEMSAPSGTDPGADPYDLGDVLFDVSRLLHGVVKNDALKILGWPPESLTNLWDRVRVVLDRVEGEES